jgi:hypothetical protein
MMSVVPGCRITTRAAYRTSCRSPLTKVIGRIDRLLESTIATAYVNPCAVGFRNKSEIFLAGCPLLGRTGVRDRTRVGRAPLME